MEIKDRIKIIMEKENMASGAFAESIGIQQSTLSHILNGRNNPSLDVIMKVHMHVNIVLPDENSRRVGQSVAAAGLPAIK